MAKTFNKNSINISFGSSTRKKCIKTEIIKIKFIRVFTNLKTYTCGFREETKNFLKL